MRAIARRWVALFDERESATPIVLIRVILAAVVFWDLLMVRLYDLPVWLWAPVEEGGVSPVMSFNPVPLVYRIFPATAATATGIYVVLLAAILCFGIGLFTRTSGLVFALLYAQTAMINDYGDRGIDRAIRVVILILAFSAAGKAWSVDAKRKTGRFRGDGKAVPAWPRYLILGQLVLIYCAAGFSKGGTRWFPWGEYAALYVILQDPIFAVADFSWMKHPVPYFFTQVGTAITHLWEMGAPIVLVAAHFRRTADRTGRLRRVFNRLPVRDIYVLVGVSFHLLLAVTLRLGIFPFAMLALFPAFYRPEELERFGEAVRAKVRGGMRHAAVGLLLFIGSCALFSGPRQEEKERQPAKPAAPAWTAKKRFYEEENGLYRLYGVGELDLPKIEKGECPAPHLLANSALGRARAQIAAMVDGARSVYAGREVSAAELLGSEPAMGWYDGERTIFVAAKLETSTAPPSLDQLERHSPNGGVAAAKVVDAVKSAMLAKLDATGVCRDPHRRMKNKCCGPAERFCSDPTRYSRKLGPDTCACGNQRPCLYDFVCEPADKGNRCVCRGPKCPCTILNCKEGQTCGDGRCY